MLWSHFRRISGRPAASVAAGALALALAGCSYGFEGGGFPSHIRTIYIAQFDNETPQFEVGERLFAAMLERLPSQLGVRVAGEEVADAILTGRITRYDDVAQNYRRDTSAGAPDVFTHEVQIGINAQLVDVRENVIRWEGSVTGRGVYRPNSDSDEVGQRKAIENLIEQIVDGAQSQW